MNKKNKIKEQTSLFCKAEHLPLKKGEFLKNNGFTLVELLVVISIIGILTVITASSFVESQKKSRDAARKSNLKSLADAVSLYYADQGSFPTTATMDLLISQEGELSKDGVIYMKKVPKEKTNGVAPIKYTAGGQSFRIFASLENVNDGDGLEKGICNGLGYTEISEGKCYIVTSSNIGTTETLK